MTEHENWVDWARQSAEAEIRDLRIEWQAAIARAETAEAALAHCQHDLAAVIERKEYFRQVWEVAEAALARCGNELEDMMAQRDCAEAALAEAAAPCVWVRDGVYLLAPCGYLTTFTQYEFSFCPGCGHRVEVAP